MRRSPNARAHHQFVHCAFGNFGNRDDVVACFAQSVNYGSRTALVGQEIHASGSVPNRSVREQHHFLVGHARRAVGDRRPDVLGRQVRIIFE